MMRSGSHDSEHVEQIASHLGHTQTHKHTCTIIPPTWPATTPILIHKHVNHSPRTRPAEVFPWVIWKKWILRFWFRVQFWHKIQSCAVHVENTVSPCYCVKLAENNQKKGNDRVEMRWTYCEGVPSLAPAPSASLWVPPWVSPSLSPPASPSPPPSSPQGHKTHSRCQGSPCGKWSGEQTRVREETEQGVKSSQRHTWNTLNFTNHHRKMYISFPSLGGLRSGWATKHPLLHEWVLKPGNELAY